MLSVVLSLIFLSGAWAAPWVGSGTEDTPYQIADANDWVELTESSGDWSAHFELTGDIDLALLPLGPGCQTMVDYEVVQALERIQPTFFIPIHYGDGVHDTWIAAYGDVVEDETDCTPVVLEYWTKHTFELYMMRPGWPVQPE